MKILKRIVIPQLFVLFTLLLFCCIPATAANSKKAWVISKKGVVSYLDENGKKLTGLQTIDKQTYLFDKQGRQLVGWQKVGSDYRFFTIQKAAKGCMVKGRTVNGIKINSKGIASKKSSKNSRKLKVMVAANKTLQKITKYNLKLSKKSKLKKCFDYTKKNYYCCNIGSFRNTSTWDIDYAERVIIPKDSRRRADCYTYGCAVAYFANACGYTNAAAVSSGGHGWCEVGNNVCDANWSMVDHANNYFMRSYDAAGNGYVPAYKRNRAYVKKI